MKRKPQLTKREKKALAPPRPAAQPHNHGGGHIHCISCGRHIDANEFDTPATAAIIRCDHGSEFPSCTKCLAKSTALVKEHDQTNQPVRTAGAWH
ncbi:MAG: hypothetical protein JWP97_3843 [Labilithrix sp.]|nr:hypothetical protein [Labilithrix sp.]